MLNGPALLRVFLVVIAAAVLTGLVQHYWIFDTTPPEPTKTVARPSVQNPPVRRPDPAPIRQQASGQTAQAPAAPPKTPTPQTTAPAPKPQAPAPAPPAPPQQASMFGAPDPTSPASGEPETQVPAASSAPVASEPAPTPQPSPRPPQPRQAAPAKPAPPQPEPATADAPEGEATDPRAVDLVDLNSATLAQLNALKGGGAIGRAIIQQRPYASTDQLLSKRVLSRTTYQRIKDQVTVR